MEKLTGKERAIYEYVKETIEKNGYSPSVRDIRSALGIKSTSTVHVYIQRL
ncbi:MAG: repressor LexA, partial [Clostridia bacterium]|nr:repressor LexA [Clostridia bacterium]